YSTLYLFFFSSYRDHLNLHSFPTRRSSDLNNHAKPSLRIEFSMKLFFDCRNIRQRRRTLTTGNGNGFYVTGFDKRQQRSQISREDRKSTRLNSSHVKISYAVFCLKKKKNNQ